MFLRVTKLYLVKILLKICISRCVREFTLKHIIAEVHCKAKSIHKSREWLKLVLWIQTRQTNINWKKWVRSSKNLKKKPYNSCAEYRQKKYKQTNKQKWGGAAFYNTTTIATCKLMLCLRQIHSFKRFGETQYWANGKLFNLKNKKKQARQATLLYFTVYTRNRCCWSPSLCCSLLLLIKSEIFL